MIKQQPKRTLQITIDSDLLYEFRSYEKATMAFEEFTGSEIPWHELNLRDKELDSKIELFENFFANLVGRPEYSGDFTFEFSPEEQEQYGIDKDSYKDVEGYTCKEIIPDLDLREGIIKTLGLMGLIDLTEVLENVNQSDYAELLDCLVPQELIDFIKTYYPNLDVENQGALKNILYGYRVG